MPTARINIRVIPRAKRDDVEGRRGDAFVVRLQAPPVEGAANKALVKILAKKLGVRSGDVTIVAGHKARDKVIEVKGVSQAAAEEALLR